MRACMTERVVALRQRSVSMIFYYANMGRLCLPSILHFPILIRALESFLCSERSCGFIACLSSVMFTYYEKINVSFF